MSVNKKLLLGVAIGMTVAFLVSTFSVLHGDNGRNARIQVSISEAIGVNKSRIGSPHYPINAITQVRNGIMSPGDDQHFHAVDNEQVARALSSKVRVLIWVMTCPSNLRSKAATVRDTWGKRVDKLIFFSSETDKTFPTIGLNVSEGRQHLTAKTMNAFRYIYDHHFHDADWFMKVDDDTYVIVENLRYFLSNENHSDPVFFGHHFKPIVKQGYYSGGGGYVLSKEALHRLGTRGRDRQLCRQDGGPEDAELGRCMQGLGVRTANSTDALGRSRFHCFNPETHIHSGFPKWYYHYDSHGAKGGPDTISDYAISFHYVPPKMMRSLDFYTYHLRPYGIQPGDQNLNVEHRRKH